MNNNKPKNKEDNANYKRSKTKEDRLKINEIKYLNEYYSLEELKEKLQNQGIFYILYNLPYCFNDCYSLKIKSYLSENDFEKIDNSFQEKITLKFFSFNNFIYCNWCFYHCLNSPEEIIASKYELEMKISDISSTICECKNHKSVISKNPKLEKIISEFNSIKEEEQQKKLKKLKYAIVSEETGNNILYNFCYIINNEEIREFIFNNIKADDEIYKQIFSFFQKDKNNKYKSKIMLFYFLNYIKNSFNDFKIFIDIIYENFRYFEEPISFLQLINIKNQALEPYLKIKKFLIDNGIRSFDIYELIKNEIQITHLEYFALELYNDDKIESLKRRNFYFNYGLFEDLPYIFDIYMIKIFNDFLKNGNTFYTHFMDEKNNFSVFAFEKIFDKVMKGHSTLNIFQWFYYNYSYEKKFYDIRDINFIFHLSVNFEIKKPKELSTFQIKKFDDEQFNKSTIEKIINYLEKELQGIDSKKSSEVIKENQDITIICQLYDLFNLKCNHRQEAQKYNFDEIINKII